MKPTQIIGLDLGTNSVSLIIRDNYDNGLLQKKIVAHTKVFSNDSSLSAERAKFRSTRHSRRHTHNRKIAILKHLIKYGYCPLTMDELNRWRFDDDEKGYDRTFPDSDAFMNWICLRFSDKKEQDYSSIYELRSELMDKDFDFENNVTDRYKLGRVLYSMAVHRGFKSLMGMKAGQIISEDDRNIKSEDNMAMPMRKLMKEHGFKTIGQAYYYLEKNGSFAEGEYGFRIRNSEYKPIRSLYKEEIKEIFKRQNLDESSDFAQGILSNRKGIGTIFYQIPVKKGKRGHCILEPLKERCSIASPLFEEFRALQLINNIRIKLSADSDERRLDVKECMQLYNDVFLRYKREYFDFSCIRKYLEKMFSTEFSKEAGSINYDDSVVVYGCPVTVRINNIFGNKKLEDTIAVSGSKTYTLRDIINMCKCLEDDEIMTFAKNVLNMDDDATKDLLSLSVKIQSDGVCNLSTKALKRINRMLRLGMMYSDAVMYAKVPDILGDAYNKSNDTINGISVIDIAEDFKCKFKEQCDAVSAENMKRTHGYLSMPNILNSFVSYMHRKYPEIPKHKWDNLYHHSNISFYDTPEIADDGNMYLPDPVNGKIIPPSCNRTLYILRNLINDLIEDGKIDDRENVRFVVEVARDMCDGNTKFAIDVYNKYRESENNIIKKIIEEDLKIDATEYNVEKLRLLIEQGEHQNDYIEKECSRFNDSKNMAKRYKIWKEQNYISLYTGKAISLNDLFSDAYDIEHTLPISKSYDDSLANKTICEAEFNRNVKNNMLPVELPNYEEIKDSIVIKLWSEKISRLKQQVKFWTDKSLMVDNPDTKNDCIRQKILYNMECEYWQNKINRFFISEIDDNFRHSQLNDTRIITRMVKDWLKSIFPHVSVQNGATTSMFREIFGIAKDRSMHVHHAIDALMLSIIPYPQLRDEILEIHYQIKTAEKYGQKCDKLINLLNDKLEMIGVSIPEVHDTVEYIKNNHIISHIYKDNKMSSARKDNSDVFRGKLHEDTIYGKINNPHTKKEQNVYNVSIDVIKKNKNKLNCIVDPQVRKSIEAQLNNKYVWMLDKNGNPIKKDKNDRPLMPIRHVRLTLVPQQQGRVISVKNKDKDYKHQQYRIKGGFVACVLKIVQKKKKQNYQLELINGFELAQLKREHRNLALKCKTTKEFIEYIYNTSDVKCIIIPGTILIKKDETLSESKRTFIVNTFGLEGLKIKNHLDPSDSKNITVKQLMDNFDIKNS